jgi:hypothetical protein
MTLSRFLEKGTLNFICYGRYVKTVSYTNKKFEIIIFWIAISPDLVLLHRNTHAEDSMLDKKQYLFVYCSSTLLFKIGFEGTGISIVVRI